MNTPATPANTREKQTDAPSSIDAPIDRSANRLRSLASCVNPWDLFFLGMLILLAFKVNWGLHFLHDINAPDEPYYMYCGYRWNLPPAQMAPLYSAWYFLLSLVATDPVELFYLSWFLLPMTLAIGVYLLARSLGAVPLFGFLSAGAVLLSRIPDVEPRPMHFAATLVLTGLAVAMQFRSAAMRLALATLSLGLASFARPEFTLAFFGMGAILLTVLAWDGWRRRASMARLIGMGVLAIVPFCLLAQCFGLPMGGTRSGIAFSQHYSITKFQAGLIDVKSRTGWTGPGQNFEEIVKEDFGKPIVSPLEALKLAPRKVIRHVYLNALAIVSSSVAIVASFSDAVSWGLWGYLALLVVVGLAVSSWHLRRRSIRDIFSRATLPALMAAIVLAPIVASCLIIHPRDHYLVGLVTITLAFTTSLVSGISLPMGGKLSRVAVVAVAGSIILVAPNNSVHWQFGKLFAANPKPVERRADAELVEFIRQVPLQGPLHIIDKSKNGIFRFTGLGYRSVAPREVTQHGFTTTLERMDINVVVLRTQNPRRDMLRHDPGYIAFRKNPPPGWVVLGHPHQYWWLAVRRDALEPGASLAHLRVAPKLQVATENQYTRHLQ